jgi:hypothetical protein
LVVVLILIVGWSAIALAQLTTMDMGQGALAPGAPDLWRASLA